MDTQSEFKSSQFNLILLIMIPESCCMFIEEQQLLSCTNRGNRREILAEVSNSRTLQPRLSTDRLSVVVFQVDYPRSLPT